MKKFILFLFVLIMFGCDPSNVVDLAIELNKEKHHQVGLSEFCTDTASKIWYCISETESNRLKELTQ